MLARLAAAHGGIIFGGAVAAGDMYRLTEVLPDALQQHHQLVVDEDDVAALAGELADTEAGRKLPGGVAGHGIFSDGHKENVEMRCKNETKYRDVCFRLVIVGGDDRCDLRLGVSDTDSGL